MIKIAVSNIAWDPSERVAIYARLAEAGVNGLEIAPGLAFADQPDAMAPSADAIATFRQEIERFGLELVSMQSLLFGVDGAFLFGGETESKRFEHGLERAISLAARLSIANLVVGSPRNRIIPDGMERAEAERHARDVFRRLGERALAAGTRLALEPNPVAYGTNFLNTLSETIAFADEVDHPAVTLNFDIGALIMNGEIGKAAELYNRGATRISHVHVSEPHLAPAPRCEDSFAATAGSLLSAAYSGWFSLEMRPVGTDNSANVVSCAEACVRQLKAVTP
jgi:sugar phosphate isomerase/epimerase